jgi:hypothetical protein
MRRGAGALLAALFYTIAAPVPARGVSPYLPLNLSPEIERQIERVLILADKPVLRRPIAAALVLDALPKACEIDPVVCAEVRRYLRRFMASSGVPLAQVELAAHSGEGDVSIPNRHGLEVGNSWDAAVQAFYQPSDYALVSVGGVAYSGDVRPNGKTAGSTPTGTALSLGFDVAQLDIGYTDHWFSPLTDSSMLISTEAPTIPSVTLSNYAPLTRLGLQYELFYGQLSRSDLINYLTGHTSGNPNLAGVQVGIEPVSGYAFGLNRILQFGGGARGGSSLTDIIHAFFDPLKYEHQGANGATPDFGQQMASITSSILFPGRIPFAVRAEFAGNDNSYAGNYRLGKTDLTLGLDFPAILNRYDVTFEVSEFQSTWYTKQLYGDGVTNYGDVIGNWFGDQRQFGDAPGGISEMLRFGWQPDFGGYFQAQYRTLANAFYSPVPYKHYQELDLHYWMSWRGHTVGAEIDGGRDVFGDNFARIAASMDLAADRPDVSNGAAAAADQTSVTDLFVDFGLNNSHVQQIWRDVGANYWTDRTTGPHLGLGARRAVSEQNDLGARLEFDRINGSQVLSLRMLDYRYRLTQKFALGGFFGVGRYEFGLPLYGYYWGAGAQLLDLWPRWDLSLDWRHDDKLTRQKYLASDPYPGQTNNQLYFDIAGAALYLSYHF